MKLRARFTQWLNRASDAPNSQPALPSRGDGGAPISTEGAVRLVSVYRAISIISTAAAQLPLEVERGGRVLTAAERPAWVRKPCLHMSRSDFIEQIVLALATGGNAYLLRHTDGKGIISDVDVLDPAECFPEINAQTGVKRVWWRGRAYSTDEIQHLALMPLPSRNSALGLGPIQAASTELGAAQTIRDYAAKWFTETGQPAGILSTDQDATGEQLTAMRNAWNYQDAEGNPLDAALNPSRIRVLSKGMTYAPIFISPKDAQWIEARQFTTTEIARLFGVPASLMLTGVDGNSQTYSNVEQEWIAFTRFTLTQYLRKIEEALTALAPLGQTIRFNIEGLLRSDTLTRYQAHQIAISTGFETINEAREIEGRPPLDPPTPEEDTDA